MIKLLITYISYLKHKALNLYRLNQLIYRGVKFTSIGTVAIEGNVIVGDNVCIGSNVVLRGDVTISDGVIIGDNCHIENTRIGKNTNIKSSSILDKSDIGLGTIVGPFARIRPNSKIMDNVQVGTFVEIKNSTVGSLCKVNHLAFLGDAVLEEGVIIGAGSVTCNWDGKQTRETLIEKNAFIGSGVYLVAPLRVGQDSIIGAGSVITKDVDALKMTIARSDQINIKDL